jgi:hypothetical protein
MVQIQFTVNASSLSSSEENLVRLKTDDRHILN